MTRDPERLLSLTSDPVEHELLASLRNEQAPANVRRDAWQGIAAALAAAASATAAAAGAVLSSGSATGVTSGSAAVSSGSIAQALPGSAAAGLAAPAGTGSAAIGGSAAIATSSIAPAAVATGGKLAAGLATKTAALLIAKWVVIGALAAGTVAGAIWAVEQKSAPQAPVPPPSAFVAPRVAEPVARDAQAAHVSPAESSTDADQVGPSLDSQPTAAEGATSKHVRIDALAAESALLQAARAYLRRGELDEAERALQHLGRRFPRGVLRQERDVLRIELASARGDDPGAQRLAARFLRAHPESPHAAQLRPLVAAP